MKKIYLIFVSLYLSNTFAMTEEQIWLDMKKIWHEQYGTKKPVETNLSDANKIQFGQACFLRVNNLYNLSWNRIKNARNNQRIGSMWCCVLALMFYHLSLDNPDYYGAHSLLIIICLYAAHIPMLEDLHLENLYREYGDEIITNLIREELK